MQSLRIVPDLRSSVVEEKPASQGLLFTSQRDDADAALLTGPMVRPFTWARLVEAARDPDLELLEVAEPLWLGEWVRAIRYIVLVKVLRALRPGRRGLIIATYAIDNLDVRVRLRPRRLESRPLLAALVTRVRVLALGASLLLLDTIVFGTTGAAENYRQAFGRALRRTRHTVLAPRVDTCAVCGPVVAAAERDRNVLFLGTPSDRKGFPVLVDAWERSGAAERGWRLVVLDPAGPAGRPVPPGVEVRVGVPRSEVHALLRSSAVVAMPSVRLPRWREQIGLPLVEGLAHGCRVVTTTETGLADDLRAHPLVVLTRPGDPEDLAEGLRRAMEATGSSVGVPGSAAGRDGATKRDVVAWWLSAGPAGPPSPCGQGGG